MDDVDGGGVFTTEEVELGEMLHPSQKLRYKTVMGEHILFLNHVVAACLRDSIEDIWCVVREQDLAKSEEVSMGEVVDEDTQLHRAMLPLHLQHDIGGNVCVQRNNEALDP